MEGVSKKKHTCDVVEEKHESTSERGRRRDSAPDKLDASLVDELRLGDHLGSETGVSECLLLVRQPAGRVDVVGESEPADDGKTDGDDTLDEEDHLPALD